MMQLNMLAELFASEQDTREPWLRCWEDTVCKNWHYRPEAREVVRRLFEEEKALNEQGIRGFQAFERVKALRAVYGINPAEGWKDGDELALGIWDSYIDYHVVWDRCWAALHGFSKDKVQRIAYCHYEATEPTGGKYYDSEGAEVV